MNCKTRGLIGLVLLAGAVIACGAAGDGGQSGTGISAIRGNVIAAAGTNLPVDEIRVSLTGTQIETFTDAEGRFELEGEASGPGELRFERERDQLFARTDVVIPAGGVLELAEVVIDPDSDEARPTLRRVEFEGFVEALDCAGGAIRVTAKEDEAGTIFTVEVASATIRQDDRSLTCGDLQVGDRVEVDAETPDGETLINAEIVLEDREDNPGDDMQEGSVDDPRDDGELEGDDESHDGEDLNGDDGSEDQEDPETDDEPEVEEDSDQGNDDGSEDQGDSEPDDEPEVGEDSDQGHGDGSDVERAGDAEDHPAHDSEDESVTRPGGGRA